MTRVAGSLPRVAVRLAASVALGLSFYASSWLPLRFAARDWVSFVLRRTGWEVEDGIRDGQPALRVAGKALGFSADCTYVDLFLLTVPFTLRRSASIRRNVARLAALAVIVGGVDLARIAWAASAYAGGGSWLLVHDLIDTMLYYPILIVAALGGFGEDVTRRPSPPGTDRFQSRLENTC